MHTLTTFPDWETIEEDMDGVGLANMLRQVYHKKGAAEKKQIMNVAQATKNAFMCWQQRN